jgi:hypothetical protein
MSLRLFRFAPALLVTVTMTFAADVSTDYDRHADFSNIHTYSWIGVRAGDQLWQDRIMQVVDSAFAAKGSAPGNGARHFGDLLHGIPSLAVAWVSWHWRGHDSKPEKNDKKLEEAVEKMFMHFPPATEG